MITIEKLIKKKQKNKKFSKKEIYFFVNGYISGNITDEKMTELLKEICKSGMVEKETINLTDAMLNSGDKIDLSQFGCCLDKHSSGGVSDSTTLIIAPIVASLNAKMVKMSGGSLGFTGGTKDKFQCFGACLELPFDKITDIVNKVGAVIVCQTDNLVPADKKIYALRDKTDTVASIPLIASSIVSKKLASGAKIIVLDVKYGKGAFMQDLVEAKKLASLMVKILKKHKVLACAVVSDMNQPLGNNIGSYMEAKEVVEILKSNKDCRLLSLSKTISSILISKKENISLDLAYRKVEEVLFNGKALEKLKEMVLAQGGNLKLFTDEKLNYLSVNSDEGGYVDEIDTQKLGELTHSLCLNVGCKGISVLCKVGDKLSLGDEMVRIYAPKKYSIEYADKILKCFKFSKSKTNPLPLIYDIID